MKSHKPASSKENHATPSIALRAPAFSGRMAARASQPTRAFTLCLALLALFSLILGASATHAGAAEYAFCANENEFCGFQGTMNVGYGVNGKMVYRNATNGINCNNQAFGNDPAYGVRKQCVVGPQGFSYCAGEGGACNFNGTRTILYGTSNHFVRKIATNGIVCTNAAFGSDPRVGVKKSCFVSYR